MQLVILGGTVMNMLFGGDDVSKTRTSRRYTLGQKLIQLRNAKQDLAEGKTTEEAVKILEEEVAELQRKAQQILQQNQ